VANPASMALSLVASSVAFRHSMESSHISCFSVGTPSIFIFSSSWVRDILYFFWKRFSIPSKRANSFRRRERSSLAVLFSIVIVFMVRAFKVIVECGTL